MKQEIEIARMWKMKTQTIPAVIGALGVIKKGMEKYVDKNSRHSQHQRAPKHYSFVKSSHPQKGSVNQVNFLVPKDHGLAPAWFRDQISNSRITNRMIIMII